MPFNKKVVGLLGALAAVVLIAAVVVPNLGNTLPAANGKSRSVNAGTVAFKPGFDKTPDDALCKNDAYINSSSQTVKVGDGAYRQFATAVSIPFKGTTDDKATDEIISEDCGNPTVLKMVVDDMMLWTGFPGAEENKEWISKIQSDMNTQGLDSFSGTNKAGDKIVSPEFQKYAGWINTVVLRFKTKGQQPLTSVRNWELPATANPATQPVAVLAANQESKPSRVRTLFDKNDKCLYKIGFNSEDKRIETFDCVVPVPPTSVTPPGTPPGTPPSSGCVTDCYPENVCPPGQTGTPPICKDGGSTAPNWSDGNGLSNDPTPSTPSPTPTQPPVTPRVDTAPAPVPAPTLVPDPAPAPAPEPSATAPVNPSTGCSPAPGMTTC